MEKELDISRRCRVEELVAMAHHFSQRLEDCFQDFSSVVVFIDREYLKELNEMVARFRKMPSEEMLTVRYNLLLQKNEALLVRAHLIVQEISVAVERAFAAKPQRIREFNLCEYNGLMNRREEILPLFDKLIRLCNEYREPLEEEAFREKNRMELREVRNALDRMQILRRNFLRNRAILLQERKQMECSITERLKEINRVARVIYSRDPIRMKWFEFRKDEVGNPVI